MTNTAITFTSEPGNMTRYEIAVTRLTDLNRFMGCGDDYILVVSSVGQRAYPFRVDSAPHVSYVSEKLALSDGDAPHVTTLISKAMDAMMEDA